MKSSADRILTTHVGSLPRSAATIDALLRKERGESYDPHDFDRTVKEGVADVVARQTGMGIDVVSDGETGKIGYSTYVHERLTGFGGDFTPKPNRDLADHPEFRRRMALFMGAQPFKRMCCIGPIALKDTQAVHTDIAHFRAALAANPAVEGFLNAASPGVVASFLPNSALPKPRGLHPGRCRSDAARIRGHRRGWTGAAGRLPGPGHVASYGLPGPQR